MEAARSEQNGLVGQVTPDGHGQARLTVTFGVFANTIVTDFLGDQEQSGIALAQLVAPVQRA